MLGMTVWRNSSIFNEPPCAVAFYGMVLAIDLYIGKKVHWGADLCIIGALVTSLSTGGCALRVGAVGAVAMEGHASRTAQRLRYALLSVAALVSIAAVVAGTLHCNLQNGHVLFRPNPLA